MPAAVDATRAVLGRTSKRWAFVAYAMMASVAYAIVHDHVTASLSPEYFLRWKGLAADPRPFRVAVTVLAVRAGVPVGLAAGVLLLAANELGRPRGKPRATYGALIKATLVPLGLAALFAALFGLCNFFVEVGSATARSLVAADQARAFVTAWAVHVGSYVGALAGLAMAAVAIARSPRSLWC